MPEPVTADRLGSLFRPRAIAMVGASDKSLFSVMAHSNVERFGFADRTILVNPRSSRVHGRATVPTLVGMDHDVDAALLMVPRAAMHDALSELSEAGVRNALVLSADYAEAGPEGLAAQEALVAHARSLDMVVLGPNHLGFANLVDGIPVIGMPDFSPRPGNVGLISQSGGSISSMAQFASLVGVDFSFLVTLGNEAMVSAGSVLDFLVEDPSTRAIAMFIESIREPEIFAAAARRARAAGKAVVVLKAGSSELAARAAVAHTGALVGDDVVTDAIFRELGIIRVQTIEDMIVTAGTAAFLGPVDPGGVGFITHSGGACDIIADSAERLGLPIATLSTSTRERLAEVLPSYATASNPLDVTGAGVNNPEIMSGSIEAIADDPGVSVVAVVNALPWEQDDAWTREPMTRGIARGMTSSSTPSVFVNQVVQPVSTRTREIMADTGIAWVIPGIAHGTAALASILEWSSRPGAGAARAPGPEIAAIAAEALVDAHRAWSEAEARALIERAGVPVAPSATVGSEDEAVAAASRWPGPLAVKLVSSQIAHKSDIGGVVLGVEGDQEVREAFRVVQAAGRDAGAPDEGVLVGPLRPPGLEVLLGVTRDDVWGAVLTIAIGGVYTEVLKDAVTLPLPTTPERVVDAVGRLRGADLFAGVRGAAAVDVGGLADIATSFGDLGVALGPGMEAMEVNPLRWTADGWEALDALVVWSRR